MFGRCRSLCLESNSFCCGAWTNEITIQSQWIKSQPTASVTRSPIVWSTTVFSFLFFNFCWSRGVALSVSFFLGKGHSCLLLVSRPCFLWIQTGYEVYGKSDLDKQVLAITTFSRIHSKMIKSCPCRRLPTYTQSIHIAAARWQMSVSNCGFLFNCCVPLHPFLSLISIPFLLFLISYLFLSHFWWW